MRASPNSAADPLPPASIFDLTGRVALVTGASSGLGHRFVKVLHHAGASIVAVARREDRLEQLAREHDRVLPLVADLSDAEQVRKVVPRALEHFGRLDVLVNNAGLGTPIPAEDEELAAFRYTLEVNLVGLFQLTQLAARSMLDAGAGSIINVASIFGLVSSWPLPNASYTASKGAVVQLTRDLACQWAARGVRVNALAPGFFPSESTAELVENPQGVRFVERGCPMGRLGRAEELDGPLLFLASAASSYMTGQTLTIDGGWTVH